MEGTSRTAEARSASTGREPGGLNTGMACQALEETTKINARHYTKVHLRVVILQEKIPPHESGSSKLTPGARILDEQGSLFALVDTAQTPSELTGQNQEIAIMDPGRKTFSQGFCRARALRARQQGEEAPEHTLNGLGLGCAFALCPGREEARAWCCHGIRPPRDHSSI